MQIRSGTLVARYLPLTRIVEPQTGHAQEAMVDASCRAGYPEFPFLASNSPIIYAPVWIPAHYFPLAGGPGDETPALSHVPSHVPSEAEGEAEGLPKGACRRNLLFILTSVS